MVGACSRRQASTIFLKIPCSTACREQPERTFSTAASKSVPTASCLLTKAFAFWVRARLWRRSCITSCHMSTCIQHTYSTYLERQQHEVMTSFRKSLCEQGQHAGGMLTDKDKNHQQNTGLQQTHQAQQRTGTSQSYHYHGSDEFYQPALQEAQATQSPHAWLLVCATRYAAFARLHCTCYPAKRSQKLYQEQPPSTITYEPFCCALACQCIISFSTVRGCLLTRN